jgi:hypothetical protein
MSSHFASQLSTCCRISIWLPDWITTLLSPLEIKSQEETTHQPTTTIKTKRSHNRIDNTEGSIGYIIYIEKDATPPPCLPGSSIHRHHHFLITLPSQLPFALVSLLRSILSFLSSFFIFHPFQNFLSLSLSLP